MKLLLDPENHIEGGRELPVPAILKPSICPWAKPVYREYDFGYILVQGLVEKEFAIYNWKVCTTKPHTLFPTSQKAMIALQINLGDSISCMLRGWGSKLLKKSTQELFYVPIGPNEALFNSPAHDSWHIELEPGYFEDISHTNPEIHTLFQMLSETRDEWQPFVAAPISYISRHILDQIKSCRKSGGDLTLNMKIFVLELISAYVEEVKKLKADLALQPIAYRNLMIQVKQAIMEFPSIKQHTIKKISSRFGINATTLKSNFKSLFGLTLASFIREQALQRAHFLIVSTKAEDLSIEDISEEVGYPYRSNFNRAFKKQYGYLPHVLRGNTDGIV